ncbi:L-threonylcarbamoyladenylate synthase [Sphingomonas echinoides]|uniref:Threonylcarbamoyl-AMP synthase n=2 Tax=Sphingomonas echinoides TaxID=59803 RepID=A0ABU4PES7_9SPHN|nr:L-threonylcarbamoyladenylate synthase [Sphingomonas echinoides]MDX5982723.1 L-threonylcarbamoyladenylate synthase [Sphingomonas echinoides]
MTTPNPPFATQTLRYGPAAIATAAALIAEGQPVAIPTETVYGLAADATDSHAVARIYAAKGRPSFNPLIVHVLDLAAAQAIATFDETALALASAFWPGPLTLVLPLRADAGIAALVTAGLPTIALRVPAHRAMRALLAATGKPLAAPSANASGAISPTRAEHVVASLGGRIPLVVDDGATEAGLESTIVLGREVLRPGPITAEALARVLGTLPTPDHHPGERRGPEETAAAACATPDNAPSVAGPRPSPGWKEGESREITAPGQLASHYAPRKPLRLNATKAASDEYLIGFGPAVGIESLSPSANLTEAAANLFDALHRADASDRARIAIAPIPSEGIGTAINDRLGRAAHRD